MEKYMLPCMNKALFGFDCPGCGMQRAVLLLCKGEFSQAFYMFPAIYTTILFFVLVGLHFGDRSHNYQKAIIWSAVANGSITIISYILKLTSAL